MHRIQLKKWDGGCGEVSARAAACGLSGKVLRAIKIMVIVCDDDQRIGHGRLFATELLLNYKNEK